MWGKEAQMPLPCPTPPSRLKSIKLLTHVNNLRHHCKCQRRSAPIYSHRVGTVHSHRRNTQKGVITWKSIGSKHVLGWKCQYVADCREDARIVDSNRTLFDAITTIVESGYVLVRDQRDRRITGIVTASDLSLQFQALAEPFLLLREIELHVRQLLGEKICDKDFALLDGAPQSFQKPQNVADLSFGQYVRLFQHPQIWAKLELKIDAGVLTRLLEEVRVIRNDVMHFDPDPMTFEELKTLKRAVRFMQELYELLP